MEHDLVQHAAQDVAVVAQSARGLNGLGDGTAQRSARTGVLLQDLAAHLGGGGGGGGDLRTVGTHDLAAEGLLLVADLDHVHAAVQTQVCAGHG